MVTDRAGGVDRSDLLARVDLRALLDHLSGPADRGGKWGCPDRDHPDEHPSVTVRVDRAGTARWRCWSGGHSGTAIDAVIAAQGCDVGTAMRWLADRYGNLPPQPARPPATPARVGAPDRAVVDYVRRAELLLWTAAGTPQRDWLAARGLGEAVLRANRVGADPGRRFLPRPKGLPGGWPAVVYPALSAAGEITYLQARYLTPPEGRSKFDNPAARLAANPRVTCTVATGAARPGGLLVVCEGAGDALIAAQAGYRSVGVLGALYPDAVVVDAIAAVAAGGDVSQVVVCFDNDPAGTAGGGRLCELLDGRGLAAVSVTPPEGLDLTGWATSGGDWTASLDATNPTPAPAPMAVREPAAGVDTGGDVFEVDGFGMGMGIGGLEVGGLG